MEAAPFFRKLVGSNEDGQRKAMEQAGMRSTSARPRPPFRKAVESVYAGAREISGADKVNEMLAEVEKIKKMYLNGKVYFGPGDRTTSRSIVNRF